MLIRRRSEIGFARADRTARACWTPGPSATRALARVAEADVTPFPGRVAPVRVSDWEGRR
jgi:hypothetical protein